MGDLVVPLIVLLIIIGVISSFTINYYNKMKIYKNDINRVWNSLRVAVDRQFNLVEVNLNSLGEYFDVTMLTELINGHKLMALPSDITVSYVKLERIILSKENPLYNAFFQGNNSLLEAKKLYNDYVLGYNNIVNSFPGYIVAKIFGFIPETYFINKD